MWIDPCEFGGGSGHRTLEDLPDEPRRFRSSRA